MTLALRMGRTLDELTRQMSLSELRMWMAFDRINPIGDIRSDIQTAHLVSSIYHAQGGKCTLSDVLLRWDPKATQESDDSSNGLENFFQSISEN